MEVKEINPHHPVAAAPLQEPVNIICLKWGKLYSCEYVNKLYRGVKKHLDRPFRMVCFTDDPSGVDPAVECRPIDPLVVVPRLANNIMLKITLLHSHTGLKGPTLFLDLDVIIMGSLDDLFDYKPDRFCMIHNWVAWRKQLLRPRPDIGNSSVVRFMPGTCDHALDRFIEDPDHAYNDFPTEQAFMTDCMRQRRDYWPADWVHSFKHHCKPIFPLNLLLAPRVKPGIRILVFHGRPNPDEAIAGYRGKLRHTTRPAPQLAEHWV